MKGNNSMGDRQESIMVVDDTPANLRLLTDILQTKGYGTYFSAWCLGATHVPEND
jgi:CheY-like chemotaxis protein